jgi:pimeloyl-ACP methyl ester carboxylesterase
LPIRDWPPVAPAHHGGGSFYDGRRASLRIAKYYEQKFASKAWRQALFETVRGTKSHSVLDKLLAIHRPTLVICGQEDRIVDSDAVYNAVQYLPNFEFQMILRRGHAPQLECPTQVNRNDLQFLNMRKL